MISAELQKAIDSLQIDDVYVRELSAHCLNDFDPKYENNFEALVVQTKHVVKKSQILELDNDQQFLRVFLNMGARWIDEKNEEEATAVKALVEAEFVAEYLMKAPLEQACINEFSLKNASYHVWPYWRELLSSQCDRMHLPRAVLPTVQFASNRPNGAPGKDDDSGKSSTS